MSIDENERGKHFKTEMVYPDGQGGQHAGSPRSEVKVTHEATGLYAVCGFDRSQHKNRSIAMSMVEYGLAGMGIKL